MRHRLGAAAVALALAMLTAVGGISAQESRTTVDSREDYAYTLGVQAYVFGFPYVYLPTLRWNWVTQP